MTDFTGDGSVANGRGGTQYGVFVVCAPGLEPLLAEELTTLSGDAKVQRRAGGCEVRVPASGLWRVVHGSRLAEGVRVRLGSFEARTWDALQQGIRRLPTHAYLPRDGVVRVRVVARKSKLIHSDAIRERVVAALGRREATDPDAAGTWDVWVRNVHDRVTVSVDAAGSRLYQRGYRTHVGEAPLREPLAAALARTGVPVGGGALWDPFCGSGTVLIEAALAQAGGWVRGRDFAPACTRWPSHSAQSYASWWAEAAPPAGRGAPLTLVGSDSAARELAAARANGRQASLPEDGWTLVEGDFEAVERGGAVPEGSAIVTNLPYGVRSGSELAQTFARFGAMLRRRPDLGPVTVLNGYRGFERATGVAWETLADFDNRGLKVRVLRRRP